MNNRFAAILCVVLLFLSVAEFAWCAGKDQGTPGNFYLSPTVGGYFFHRPQGLEDATLYGLKFGYDFLGIGMIDSLGIEGFAARTQVKSGADTGDASIYQFRVDTIHPLLVKKKLIPFLALGAGWVTVDGDSLAEDGPVVALGFGAKYSLTNYLLLRADFRDMIWFEPGQDSYFETSLGLTYVFGQERIKKTQPPPDSDRDGVADGQDKCPDTPRGLKVDKRGCPTDTTDSDGDKVPDYRDQCKATPRGAEVDIVGCPLDSDGDKVPDFLDRCLGTPAGVETDSQGCVPVSVSPATSLPVISEGAEEMIASSPQAVSSAVAARSELPVVPVVLLPAAVAVSATPAVSVSAAGELLSLSNPSLETTEVAVAPVLSEKPEFVEELAAPEVGDELAAQTRYPEEITVEFEFDQAEILTGFNEGLAAIVARLKSSVTQKAIIVGYTDSLGSESYNERLSTKRAENVKAYLLNQGVASSQIIAVGYGESWPIADNATEEGRQKNRRVVIFFCRVTDKKSGSVLN